MAIKGFRLKLYRSLLECSCIRWHCWIRWRLWVTVAVVLVYLLVLLVVLPLMIFGLYEVHAEVQFSAWFVAAVFVLLTIPIFLANLLQHLFNYTKPHLQAYIMRILWIVPVYSINSVRTGLVVPPLCIEGAAPPDYWLGLKFPSSAIYWSTVRECYESYALYNFLVYLLNFLGEEYVLSETMATRPSVTHPFPCCCCTPWPKGMRFIRWCKVGVLQYAVVRPFLTILALIFQWTHIYDEGHLKPDKMYVYIATANAITQGLALYALFYFYKGLNDLLKPMKPVLKFGAIKAIIFFTFWQAIIISLLVKLNVIKQSVAWEKYGFQDVANSIQDFVICIEMLIAAIGFYFIFSHRPYIDSAATQIPCLQSFIEMVDVRDIYDDVRENFVDPIPVPRLPKRWTTKSIWKQEPVETIQESAPLIGSLGPTGYDTDNRGMRQNRLGSGEESLVVYSVNDTATPTNHQTHPSTDDIVHLQLSSSDEQDAALIRERRGNNNDYKPAR